MRKLTKEISVNTKSASRAEGTTETSALAAVPRQITVWDAPMRVFHWLMVLSFAGAYVSAESERWRLLHVTLGYTMVGLVGFRLVWGMLGTRYARFASFIRGPQAVARYVGAMLRGQPQHHTGHNPAGAIAIVALLGLTLVIGASGWAIYNDYSAAWLEKTHEVAAHAMLLMVGIHIAGVAVASLLHRENLLRSMLTGRKLGLPKDGIGHTWHWLAEFLLLAVLVFWWFQWQSSLLI